MTASEPTQPNALDCSSAGRVLFHVFAPTAPLSRTRWNYVQNEDGSAVKFLTLKNGRETSPDLLKLSDVFPDALAWARCLHAGKPRFECPEAQEVYATLCNAVLNLEAPGKHRLIGARVCIEGVIEDCKEWLRQIGEQEENQ